MITGCNAKKDIENGKKNYEYSIKYNIGNNDIDNVQRVVSNRLNSIESFDYKIDIINNELIIYYNDDNKHDDIINILKYRGEISFRNSTDELVLSSDILKDNSAKVVKDNNNIYNYYLSLEITDSDIFNEKTEKIINNNDVIVIWLDYDDSRDKFSEKRSECGSLNNSRCISYATINGKLRGTNISLTGNYSKDEANYIKSIINSGLLKEKLIEE